MAKSDRMLPAIRVAENREKEAARRLGEAQQFLQQQVARREELHSYRADYRREMAAEGHAGVSAARFLQLQNFLGRLDEAIAQQESIVAQAGLEKDKRMRGWLDARAKVKAFNKVLERMRDEEEQAQMRREQKDTDEFAQRRGGGS